MKTTATLKSIFENWYALDNNLEWPYLTFPYPSAIIEEEKGKLFDFQYPLNDVIKNEFEQRFCMKYYLSEIGAETPMMFKHFLMTDLMIKSEKYNQLLKSVGLDYDIITQVNLTTSGTETEKVERDSQGNYTSINTDNRTETGSNTQENEETRNGTKETNENVNNHNITTNINTPQGQLQNFLDDKYMSSASKSDDTNTGNANETTTENNNGTVKNSYNNQINASVTGNDTSSESLDENRTKGHEVTVKGSDGNKSQSQLIMEYRETIVNVIEMLIDDLSDLFLNDMNMEVWTYGI